MSASPIAVPRTPTHTAPEPVPAAGIVTPRWLAANRRALTVLDTRRSDEHAAGHLAGARSFPIGDLVVEDSSAPALRHLARAVQVALAARGVEPHHLVALVDDGDGCAALGAVLLELAGMPRVAVLDGGVPAWQAAGGELVTVPGDRPLAVAPVGCWDDVAPQLDRVATFEELEAAARTGSARIVDARSQLEHEGIIGAGCCELRGAIPGSVHLEWTACFDMSGAPHRPEHVVRVLDHVGIGPTDTVLVTCHAGHRAALAARVMRAGGFGDVRVSIGSWHEWSARGMASEAAR